MAPGTRLAVVTQDPAEAHRSPVELAVLGDPAAICAALAEAVEPARPRRPAAARAAPAPPPAPGEPMRAGHVLAALAERLPRDAILLEETPSSRPELHGASRRPRRSASSARWGCSGFALPAAIGVRIARQDRPVLTVVGDGSSLYQIHALWSAAALWGRRRSSSCSSTAATRSWTGSRSAPGPTGRGRKLDAIDIGAMARAQGC